MKDHVVELREKKKEKIESHQLNFAPYIPSFYSLFIFFTFFFLLNVILYQKGFAVQTAWLLQSVFLQKSGFPSDFLFLEF